MAKADKLELRRRAGSLGLAALVVLVLLLGRLWQLQVVQGEYYADLADGNRMRRLSISAPRGIIRDRADRVLADNRLAFTVSVVPGGLQDNADEVVSKLATILDLDREVIEAALTGAQREYPYEPIRIRRDVSPEIVVAIEENRIDLPGVIVEQEPMRRYPAGALTAHVIGYLQLATPEDLRSFEGYRQDDLVGRIGVERAYEERLRGEHGFEQVEVNALSRAIRRLGSVPPVPGADLHLTLDLDLQERTTAALQRQLDLIAQDPERVGPVGGGAIVVLDVRTGAVLAMVSLPTYDSNVFLTDQLGPYWSQLNADVLRPLFHRAIQGTYAPGSSFKPVTLLAALGRDVLDPYEIYHATGRVTIGGRVFRDWTSVQGLPPAGPIDAVQALERSANDYFYTAGTEAGIQAIADVARQLGLGQSTGLDLRPGDSAGIVPDPTWKRARRGEPWFAGDTANVSIGQGDLQATPLQVALLYMGIANRGTVYQPYLVHDVVAPGGQRLATHERVVLSRFEAAPSDWDVLERGLRAVISGSRGTARHAFANFPIEIAGKTGSSEVGANRESHAWFAAYAPASAPEIAVSVLIEHGGGGGGNAAPVACRVMAAYFGLPLTEDEAEAPEGSEPDGSGANAPKSDPLCP